MKFPSFSDFEICALEQIRSMIQTAGISLRDADALHEDAAIIENVYSGPDGRLVVCVDAHAEGHHFPVAEPNLQWVGCRAVSTVISDQAASGAIPEWVIVSIQWPFAERDFSQFIALYNGIIHAARRYKVQIAGGNLTSGALVSMHITAGGRLMGRRLPTRGNAGDVIALSGPIGDAGLGLLEFKQQIDASLSPAVAWYQDPLAEVDWIAVAHSYLTGCTDISDGVQVELERLARRSGCAAQVSESLMPRSEYWRAHSAEYGITSVNADPGGDDYRLLVTVPEANLEALKVQLEKSRRTVYPIGSLRIGTGVVWK